MTQVLNFASFTVQKSANERSSLAGVTRGQNFKMKFRKFLSKKGGVNAVETIYTLSNDKFAELGLHDNGIIQLISPDGKAYIAVVDNDSATMLKRTEKLSEGAEKGKKFKSTILDKALLASGVIEDKEGTTQFLDLEKVGENVDLANGIKAVAIYEIIKGEEADEENEEASEDDESSKDEDPSETVSQDEDAPALTQEAPQGTVEDTDDF